MIVEIKRTFYFITLKIQNKETISGTADIKRREQGNMKIVLEIL